MVSIVFVGARTYALWKEGPWELPQPTKHKGAAVVEEAKKDQPSQQMVSTKNIVEKNLFDPERGASRAQENEASVIAMRRIQSMVLLGTVILGKSRYAILQEPAGATPSPARGQAGQTGSLRLKLGETLEGFKLSEVNDRKVIFTKGASRVEVVIDYFRKLDDSKGPTRSPTQPGAGVPPTAPRRERLPAAPPTP